MSEPNRPAFPIPNPHPEVKFADGMTYRQWMVGQVVCGGAVYMPDCGWNDNYVRETITLADAIIKAEEDTR